MPSDITVNGRTYRWMDHPLVVVCLDGSERDYITAAVAAGAAPYLAGCSPAPGPRWSPTV